MGWVGRSVERPQSGVREMSGSFTLPVEWSTCVCYYWEQAVYSVCMSAGVICDCRSENDDGSKLEQREDNDRLRSFVRMRVKPSRTSEVNNCSQLSVVLY